MMNERHDAYSSMRFASPNAEDFETIATTGTSYSTESDASMNSISSNHQVHTSPTNCSISIDEGIDRNSRCTPVTALNEIHYAHGGYAGAAPLMMDSKKWMSILQYLMPDEHKILTAYSKQLKEPDPLKVMKWAENNPVVAAFGMLHSKRGDGVVSPRPRSKKKKVTDINNMFDMAKSKIIALQDNKRIKKQHLKPALEWDVFLDPTIVKDVDQALNTLETLQKTSERNVYEEEIIAANIEADRQVSRLLNRMMLAHGSAVQLLAEAVGVAAKYNFSRVKRTGQEIKKRLRESQTSTSFRCWDGDGTCGDRTCTSSSNVKAGDVRTSAILVDRWLQIFAQALKIGRKEEAHILSLLQKGKRRKGMLKKPNEIIKRKTSQVLRGVLSSLSFDSESPSTYTQDDRTERQFTNPSLCGLFLCLGMNDPDSLNADHSDTSMAESAVCINKELGESLRLVLDMKSRHVPPRVWGRLIDAMGSRGIHVDAIGSFDIDELRLIKQNTSTSIKSIRFFHSAGDLQRACHANEVMRGDTVYFNAGSLFGKRSTMCEAPSSYGCWTPSKRYSGLQQVYSESDFELSLFKPYAYPKDADDDGTLTECKATIADYQNHFDLSIGLYVQEFSIGSDELNALATLVNRYQDVYSLGLAWGGINGLAVKGVKGDGYWSQRYVGRTWTNSAAPSRKMRILSPEDHHVVQKALLVAACGQVSTVNHVMDEDVENLMCQTHNRQLLDFTQTGNLR